MASNIVIQIKRCSEIIGQLQACRPDADLAYALHEVQLKLTDAQEIALNPEPAHEAGD